MPEKRLVAAVGTLLRVLGKVIALTENALGHGTPSQVGLIVFDR